MRNPYRSRRDQRQDSHSGTRNVAGVGEFRAVAERLLETGAQYLEQGREWLHAATRREREEDQPHGAADPHASSGGREPGADRWRESARASERTGPGAGFSGSGTAWGGSGHAGHDYDDHRARDFDSQAEQLVRGRGRPGGYGSETWRGQRDHGHHHGSRDDDWYLPGSYGFGGEGRHQPGAPADAGTERQRWRGGGFQEASGRWEQAYQAQGQGSHRGRGPRGYARSDERILEDVNERLCDDPIVDATEIEVRCEQGCVVLEGRVPTRWMKHRAEDIADSASGVKDVDNRIRVIAEEPIAQGDFDTRRTRNASASSSGSTSPAGAASAGMGTASSGTGASPVAAASGKTSGSDSQETAASNDTTPPQPQAPH